MEMPKYRSPVSIIPGGCPQFLDFALPAEALKGVRRLFREEKRADGQEGRYSHHLRCLELSDDGDCLDMLTGRPAEMDYDMSAEKIVDIWRDHWLPAPFLRTTDQTWPDGGRRFEYGPSNWARARILPSEKDPSVLRAVVIFDTQVEDAPEGGTRHALSPQDVAAHGHFMLAHHVRDNSWFLNEGWVDDWLNGIYSDWRQARHKGGGSWRDDEEYVLQHLAAYFTWLEVLRMAMRTEQGEPLAVQAVTPGRDVPVDVDLVLDIGNSRTTGILVETLPQRPTRLADSYLLQLRNLGRPDLIYEEPFETRVEFVDASFGNDALSRRSGRRTPAFSWPSAVRVGREAVLRATRAVCAEGDTGMSSPKRYLWDERPWQPTWRYNANGGAEPLVTRGAFPRQLNAEGTPLDCENDPLFKQSAILRKQEMEPLFESHFTRSSLMMFMFGEILTQALITINSPGVRARRDLHNVPRRLRRVIFTVPTAMPVAERRIFKRWASWAVRVVWKALGWSEWFDSKGAPSSSDYRCSPRVRCDWDEASCSQLALLYNELIVKHQGDAHHLFGLMGRRRAERGGAPCVRMASLDIGGGTTDLSITTHELASGPGESARFVPHTEFRDGFDIAGDEVLRAIISERIIPALEADFRRRGLAAPEGLINQLFGGDSIGISSEQRATRGLMTRQVAAPAALGVIMACEEPENPPAPLKCRIGDFFEPDPDAPAPENPAKDAFTPARRAPRPQRRTLEAIAALAATHGVRDFDIMDVPLELTPQEVARTVTTTLAPAISTCCEMVSLYDSDILLLTGRPSAWRSVIEAVMAALPVPPDRIIPMSRYHVGSWYPFIDARGRISDPKTTVVVGAILCALAEGHLEGCAFDTRSLRLSSTARYIGPMATDGKIPAASVWFTVDVDSKDEAELVLEGDRALKFNGPIQIGYRQIRAERWPTTRYQVLTYASAEAQRRAAERMPYTVELGLRVDEIRDEAVVSSADGDRSEGGFAIRSITDRDGRSVGQKDLEIRLQTLSRDEGYWLDTGIVKI